MRGRVSREATKPGQAQVTGRLGRRVLRPDLTQTATCVLLAVIALPNPTVQDVMDIVGRTRDVVVVHLDRLEALGLISWERRERFRPGVLRATCKPVRPCRA